MTIRILRWWAFIATFSYICINLSQGMASWKTRPQNIAANKPWWNVCLHDDPNHIDFTDIWIIRVGGISKLHMHIGNCLCIGLCCLIRHRPGYLLLWLFMISNCSWFQEFLIFHSNFGNLKLRQKITIGFENVVICYDFKFGMRNYSKLFMRVFL